MGTSTNNATVIQQSTQRITALQKHLSAKGEIPIAGKRTKVAALVTLYQSVLDATAATTAAKGAYKLALASRVEAEAQRKTADESLRSWVLITYGPQSQEAHDFGFVPKSRLQLTAEERANAVALGQATREARGTRGKRQKSKIKGTLATPGAAAPAPQATTAPTAAAPAAAASPASSPGVIEPHS